MQHTNITENYIYTVLYVQNLWPVKSHTVLPMARHPCDMSSKEAVLPGHNDAEIAPVHSLHASA